MAQTHTHAHTHPHHLVYRAGYIYNARAPTEEHPRDVSGGALRRPVRPVACCSSRGATTNECVKYAVGCVHPTGRGGLGAGGVTRFLALAGDRVGAPRGHQGAAAGSREGPGGGSEAQGVSTRRPVLTRGDSAVGGGRQGDRQQGFRRGTHSTHPAL